jgi:hypothetical protein
MTADVGRSSYDDGTSTSPYRKMQVVATAFIALQVASLCYEFDTLFPGARSRGDRLTVNEGIRSRPRQRALRMAWELYKAGMGPWAALAAALYYSTHDETRGSAIDFGITMANGQNRALTVAEAAWVDANGPRRGILPTGMSFNPQERWHKNAGYAWSVAPIKGVNLPGEKFYTASAGASASAKMYQEDTMLAFTDSSTGHKFAVSPGKIHHCKTNREYDLAVKSVPGNVSQKVDTVTFKAILTLNGIPEAAADPVWITRNADPGLDGHTYTHALHAA